MYYALIGDMVGSKKLCPEERMAAQNRLSSVLKALNGEGPAGSVLPAKALVSDFTVTLGDEFQALIGAGGDPVAESIKIAHAMRPLKLRFAVGCGDIYTAIRRDEAIGADGPAYHHARRMISCMKNRRGAVLRSALGDPGLEGKLNVVLALCDALARGWTDKQEQLVFSMLMSEIGGEKKTQSELADMFGVGQSTVNLQLGRAGYREVRAGIMLVRDELARYMEEGK